MKNGGTVGAVARFVVVCIVLCPLDAGAVAGTAMTLPPSSRPLVAQDGTLLGTSHVASRGRRSQKDDLDRATRAGGVPPGIEDEQWRLAGVK